MVRARDPHGEHRIVHGPYAVAGRYVARCRCGHQLRGITRDDVYIAHLAHLADHDRRDTP